MRIDVLIPAIAAATCLQYSLFFLMLWRKNRDQEQEPLRTISVFAAGLGIMLLSALEMQHVAGPNMAVMGLLWYRVQLAGIGITPGYEERIFAPFGRGDAAERDANTPGNGIGLHLARRLAESQGGTLQAQSDGHHCGSTFVLTLPIETEE